jgi:hypothetical protein
LTTDQKVSGLNPDRVTEDNHAFSVVFLCPKEPGWKIEKDTNNLVFSKIKGVDSETEPTLFFKKIAFVNDSF